MDDRNPYHHTDNDGDTLWVRTSYSGVVVHCKDSADGESAEVVVPAADLPRLITKLTEAWAEHL